MVLIAGSPPHDSLDSEPQQSAHQAHREKRNDAEEPLVGTRPRAIGWTGRGKHHAGGRLGKPKEECLGHDAPERAPEKRRATDSLPRQYGEEIREQFLETGQHRVLDENQAIPLRETFEKRSERVRSAESSRENDEPFRAASNHAITPIGHGPHATIGPMSSFDVLLLPLVLSAAPSQPPAIDQRSYDLGGIGAFAEVVGAGVKKLALSAPMAPSQMDGLIAEAERIVERNHAKSFRETDFLTTDLFPAAITEGKHVLLIYTGSVKDEYMALKKEKQALLASGRYEGEARKDIARKMGRLLSYSDEKIAALLAGK